MSKLDQIKITKTLDEVAKENFPKTVEELSALLLRVRLATISEYGRKVSATTYYDDSNSTDGRDGVTRAKVQYPLMPPKEIELIAKVEF